MPYTTEGKNLMLNALAAAATHVGLHTAVPSTATPNEVTGGSPAYARKANTWNTASAGAVDNSNAPVFDVPAGTTVTHVGFWSAATSGVCYAYAAVTNETFGGQGTYTLTDADLDLNAA
jgi:hypothetical protein